MIRGLVRARRAGLALVVLAAVGMLIGTSPGRSGLSIDASPLRLDAVFSLAEHLLGSTPTSDDVDLHDGRSRVPSRWQRHFERFAAEDRASRPAAGGVVFVGSSSIDYWTDLPAQFPTRRVVQRGLPGATMGDLARHVDRLVLPRRPDIVVVYAGDNDLAAGVAPARIVDDCADLVQRIHRERPASRVVLVSIKPSPVRAGLMPLIRRTNAALAAYARTDRRLDFVDVFDAMLDGPERIRRDLFLPDGLHLSPAGYAIWRDALVDRLD